MERKILITNSLQQMATKYGFNIISPRLANTPLRKPSNIICSSKKFACNKRHVEGFFKFNPLQLSHKRRVLLLIPKATTDQPGQVEEVEVVDGNVLRYCSLRCIFDPQNTKVAFLGAAGVALTSTLFAANPSCASELPLLGSSFLLNEPSNALSLPTWAIHVSSVVEWATAMALVWTYGERTGYESWKGLSWGMVPLLGGALCACTWHFFYNSESLEVLVALQAALTVIGNATMCLAAYRIYKASHERSNDL